MEWSLVSQYHVRGEVERDVQSAGGHAQAHELEHDEDQDAERGGIVCY